MPIFSVYIDEGCITCDACEEAAPDVFEVTDDTCFIKPTVRLDGGFDRNDGQSGLKPEISSSLSDDIIDAADACPVDVIILVDEAPGGTPEAEESSEPEAMETPPETAVEDVVVGDGLEQLLTVGDRSLDILFGSQSGNSEDLASKLAKQAKAYGLEGNVHDMDGFDFNSLSKRKRVLVVCSTWGEGEMPDNAEDLWQFASSDAAARLEGVHFSVCALGDVSYEFYCQSGKDWDLRLEELGATRLVDRVDCDVDYEAPAASWALEAIPTLSAVDGTGQFHEDMVDSIKDYVSGAVSGGAEGEDGFTLPTVLADSLQTEVTIFRYDPLAASTGRDTWVCALPGHMSVLEVLRDIKGTQDGSLTFRDGPCDDPNTAITVNGRLVMPGLTRIDSVAPNRDGSVGIRIEPLPGFDVIRDLVIDPWSLERKRESSKPWMVATTREGETMPQGPIGTMEPATASHLHSISNYQSQTLLHASSDAAPHANGYLGPAVLASAWARRKDPRTSPSRKSEIDVLIGSSNGIKAETDLAPIRRQASNPQTISDALLEAKTATLTRDAYNGRHGKHVWWYTWSVKSSGRVNDTVVYRQVLGPIGLLGNLFSGVTARMVFGFTRTGGNMFNGMLGMVAPPAGIGKMPKQFNSAVENHHEVVAIFNELDGRF
ncbi:MAG: flavodoxin domain-containing protein [Candidatus Thalassarchaeaceae archaeon]|nr:flavodoxin domain-containing protein [Candidatus Thalassarchaeaceae archaeon]MDP7004133.1 flavodoxin domain-containing protein [Candidatus Thalassarchaeaceae archaeon]